nr:hypothetical protein [Streptacidiphilus carbonis]
MTVQLDDPVDGLDQALAAVDAFDRVLTGGLLRPRPDQEEGLRGLADAVAGSPLAASVAVAAEKAAAGAASEEHLVALAAGRTALLGAVHDALATRVYAVTGRSSSGVDAPPTAPAAAPNRLAGARAWLCDLARAGWQGLDRELVAGAEPVVAGMLADPALRRLASLLDGFAAELDAFCPGAGQDRFPVRRWADLWTRGMLLSDPGYPAAPPSGTVTGRLLPLGVDLHEHSTGVQAQVHAVFEPADGGPARLVRASVSAPKPDTVVGAGGWQLLRPHLSLFSALAEGLTMELTDMPVTDEGDLLWNDDLARTGGPADPFATARVALPAATGSWTAPLDRHPARLAEPVFLEGYRADEQDGAVTFALAGSVWEVDVDRLPSASPLTPQAVAASRACIGLLRWDAGRFLLQPLAVEAVKGRRTVALHAGAWAAGTTDKDGARAEKAATEAVQVLRERAGKLLRS